MSKAVLAELDKVLQKIDRPGSFCVSGSDPVVLPGLDIDGLGMIGFPLTATQAKEMKKLCEQAPYGKGEETIVDTKVRRVWRLTPDRFKLTNPDWQPFLDQTVKKVQQELGLEKQQLQSHLYDLLLYEKGSFFLPHRDGEKLDRMVATLVLVLPSAYEGGELVVRHEGEEKTIDFSSGDNSLFRIRHAAIFLWPNKKHFDILCDAGSRAATAALKGMVDQLRLARAKDAETLRAQCIQFAGAIIARWKENRYGGYSGNAEEGSLLESLQALDDPLLIKSYLTQVLARDVSVDPGAALLEVCTKYGWKTFQPELHLVFQGTTSDTIERNMRFLDQLCLARPRKKEGWGELCQALAEAILQALETIDREAQPDYRSMRLNREKLLAGLAQTLLASEQFAQLSRLVAHVLARPEKYPLLPLQFAVLTGLEPWLVKNVKKPCPALSDWIASCCAQLEALTEKMPTPPADFRRRVPVLCNCKDCGDLKRFLDDPKESTRRFPIAQSQRKHVISIVEQYHCDIDCSIDRSKSPHVLVCTKNTASYQADLATYHENRERLAKLRAIEGNLPR